MIEEGSITGRTDADHTLEQIKKGYDNKMVDAYADNLDDPKHVLVLMKCPAFWFKELQTIVLFIFSHPSVRGEPGSLLDFKKQILSYSEHHGCDTILASSWQYLGSRGIDQFWRSQGYERQEVVYIKDLKK